jgi:hypothetical protein
MIPSDPVTITVNPSKGVDVESALDAVSLRTPGAASDAIVIVTGRLESVPPLPTVMVTPVPLAVTEFTPSRWAPEIVAERDVPVLPTEGVIPVIAVLVTMKSVGVDVPPGVVTVNILGPVTASAAIDKEIGSVDADPPARTAAVMPVPLKVTFVAPDRPVPNIVAVNDVPAVPILGVMLVTKGRGVGLVTANPANGEDDATPFATVMGRTPSAASGAILTVIGSVVSVAPASITAVTPLPPKVTAVMPPRLMPVIIDEIDVPCAA